MIALRKFEFEENWAPLIFTLLVVWIWTWAAILLRPAFVFSEQFLLRDAGFSLVVADHLLRGGKLYQELFYQYGPLPAYFHAAVARIFGNSAQTFVGLLQIVCIVDVAIAYFLVRRVAHGWTTFLLLVIGLFPAFLVPGSFTVVSIGPAYPPFERTLLLLLALAWRGPSARTLKRAFVIGLLLGVMPWIKFGAAFVAAVALVLVDGAFLIRQRVELEAWLNWLRQLFATGIAFCVGQAALMAFLWKTCSSEIAWDALWPAYMIQSYQSYVGADRFPHWINLRYFVGTQLPPLTGLVLVLATAMIVLGRKRWDGLSEEGAGPFLFLGVFFGLGVFVYFKHVWLIMDYVWLLILASAWIVGRCENFLKGVVFVLWIPCALVNLKAVRAQDSDRTKVATILPNSEVLWLDLSARTRLERLEGELRLLGASTDGGGTYHTLLLPIPPGIYHYLGLARATRHAWFIPAVIRSYDEDPLVASLNRTAAIVLFFEREQASPPAAQPHSWDWFPFGCSPLPERFSAALASRLGAPVKIDARCFLFPVKGVGGKR